MSQSAFSALPDLNDNAIEVIFIRFNINNIQNMTKPEGLIGGYIRKIGVIIVSSIRLPVNGKER